MAKHKNRTPSLTFRNLSDQIRATPLASVSSNFGGALGQDALNYRIFPPFPFVAERFAKDLDQFGPSACVIADSDLYLAETDQRVWNALLRNRQLRMVAPVANEIKSWINDPRGVNVAMHQVMKAAHGRSSDAVSIIELPADRPEIAFAAEWYTNLLGIRKRLRKLVTFDGQENGVDELNSCKANNSIRTQFGARSERLAIRGDRPKVEAHRLNDEAIVVTAIFHAIGTGQETVILTRDEDVFEQFRKACWLIDTHYRAMLFADIYSRDHFRFTPIRRFHDLSKSDRESLQEAFLGEDMVLLGRPSHHLLELLPNCLSVTRVHCCRIRDRVEVLTFGFVDDMLSLLATKGRTQGRSTDKLGGMNCHISLGPRAPSLGDWVVVARDRLVANDRQSFSMIDLNLVINEGEGLARACVTRIIAP